MTGPIEVTRFQAKSISCCVNHAFGLPRIFPLLLVIKKIHIVSNIKNYGTKGFANFPIKNSLYSSFDFTLRYFLQSHLYLYDIYCL